MPTAATVHHEYPLTSKPRADRDSPPLVAATRAVLNETHKSLLLLWRQRYVVLIELLVVTATYPFIQYVIGNGTIDRKLALPTLLAFLTFPLLFVMTFKVVGDVLEEINTGTFEQMHLSPISPAWLLVGRILASVIEGVLIAAIMVMGLAWVLDISLPLRAAAVLPAALTVLDMLGFALVLGGLALRLPQIGALVHLFTGLIFVMNGGLLPIELYPGWMQTIARVLPTTFGVEALRKVVLEGQSLGAIWADGTLPWLVVHAVGLAMLGWLVFSVNDRQLKQRGISH
jgi:ABC-2 type transport system permease protein